MTTSVRSGDGRPLTLTEDLARGGEGIIWRTDRPGLLAKIYHHPAPGRADKLAALVAARPALAARDAATPPVAWPLDLLTDAAGTVVGVLVPRVRSDLTLHALAVPRLRRRLAPEMSWYRLFEVGAALARAVALVHGRGAVIGDLRADNVLVDPSGSVTLIDADSFQIAGHPCPVGSEGTTPPEMIGQDFTNLLRIPHHDRFGLAVLLYQLLLGVHPFTGIWRGEGEPPGLDAAVRAGLWPPAQAEGPLQPPTVAPPLSALPAPLPELFTAAFAAGHTAPEARPTGEDWAEALDRARAALDPCATEEGHYHASDAPCPWCALTQATGATPWPTPATGAAEPRLLDRRLLRAWRQGDRRAAAALWRRHGPLPFQDVPEDIRTAVEEDAALLPLVDQFAAACTRPGQATADLAALWHRIAASPLASGLRTEGARVAAQSALLARLAAADALPPAQLAELGAWAEALFPPRHWELDPWRQRLAEARALPRLMVATAPDMDGIKVAEALRREAARAGLPAAVLALPAGWLPRPEAMALAETCSVLVILAAAETLDPNDAAALEGLATAAPRVLPVAVTDGPPPPGAACALPRSGPGDAPLQALVDQAMCLIRG